MSKEPIKPPSFYISQLENEMKSLKICLHEKDKEIAQLKEKIKSLEEILKESEE